MFTRVVSFADAKDIDAGIQFVREAVAPVLHQQKGFAGTTASTDRTGNQLGVLSLWETEADRDASESALLKVREEGLRIVGGHLSVELFEEVLAELVAGPPAVGSSLLVTRVSMAPEKVDENLGYFRREVLPQIKANPGLLALRHMVNRQTGEAIVGTVWADTGSMRAASEAAAARQRSGDMPVTMLGRSEREIVFLDLP